MVIFAVICWGLWASASVQKEASKFKPLLGKSVSKTIYGNFQLAKNCILMHKKCLL